MNSYKLLFSVLGSARKELLGSQLFSILTIAFNIGLLATSAWLISTAALHPEIVVLSLAIVGVRFYGISRAVARYIERYVSHSMAFQSLYALRTWLYGVIEPQAPAIMKRIGSGDILGRLMGDIELLQFFYLRVLIPPATAVVITLALGVYLSFFSISFTILLLIAFILAGIIIPLFRLQYNKKNVVESLEQKSHIKNELVETLNGMLDIVAYNGQNIVAKRIDDLSHDLAVTTHRIGKGNNIGSVAFIGTLQLTILGSLYIAIPMALHNAWSGVYIATIALALQAYFEALQPMNDAFYYHWESKAAASRLAALAETEGVSDAAIRKEIEVKLCQEISCKAQAITFENVSFSYDTNDTESLFNSLSFSIKEKEKVAIVGPSGSGKSSLFSLLERFYPYKGTISLFGKDLQAYEMEKSRQLFSMVTQDPYLFHATLGDNIRLANPLAKDEMLYKAISFASLNGLVERLPQGAKTMIGGGLGQISGGERQRVSLARMYISDHPILLLDEPLEGLDSITARQIEKTLFKLMENKTVLYITHRLIGLEEMDRILFMDKGRIIEEGTYDELMKAKQMFYTYCKLSMERI